MGDIDLSDVNIFDISSPDMNKAVENFTPAQLSALSQTLGGNSPSPLYSVSPPSYSPITPVSPGSSPGNNNNASVPKRFIQGIYTGAKNPYGVLGKHSIKGNWLEEFIKDPTRSAAAVNLSVGDFDHAGAESNVDTELNEFQNGTYGAAFQGKLKGAIAKSAGNPKKLKTGLNKALKDFAEEYYPNGTLNILYTQAKRLRAQKSAVADPFQKAAFAHRIKQVDAILLKAKKKAITMNGIPGEELYARAAAAAKSGLVYEPVGPNAPYRQFGQSIASNFSNYVDEREEKITNNGRVLNPKTKARWQYIDAALRNPDQNLLEANSFRPKKSRRTNAIGWTDSINPGYTDYDPYNLARTAFGEDYASSRYIKFKDSDGKFKSVPRSVSAAYSAYANDDTHFVVLKRKELKSAIRNMAGYYLPSDIAEALRIDPELLDVLSECIDVYGRKLIMALLHSYIALEGQTEKPSLKLGLSHLMQLFHSQEGMQLVNQYALGDVVAAFAAGKESLTDWLSDYMPEATAAIGQIAPGYSTRIKVPRKKAISDRITDDTDRMTLLANRRLMGNLNRYMGYNDEYKDKMLALTDSEYAINLGRRAWEKKKGDLGRDRKEKTRKLMGTYNLTKPEVENIIDADPQFRHFSSYSDFDEVMQRGGNTQFYPPLQDMEAAIPALRTIKSKYAGLDLKSLGPERKHEAALIRALYRQSQLQGDRLHMATSSQWVATVFIVGGMKDEIKARMFNTFAGYGVGDMASIRATLETQGPKYLSAVNQLALGNRVYNDLAQYFRDPQTILPNASPETLALARNYFQIPGFFELAIHLVILQLFDQLKYSSLNTVAPSILNEQQAVEHLESFFTDKIKPEDLFSLVHGAAASAGFTAVQKLSKASSKEYDIAISTLMRNSKRDTLAMELFGTGVMKLPNLSKLSAIIFGLSKTMSTIILNGRPAFILLDNLVSNLASVIQGTKLNNFRVAESMFDALSGQTALARGMDIYHSKPATEFTYGMSKEDRKSKREARKAITESYKQFQRDRPTLQFRDAYKIKSQRQALTPKELKQLRRQNVELNEQFGNNDVDMAIL